MICRLGFFTKEVPYSSWWPSQRNVKRRLYSSRMQFSGTFVKHLNLLLKLLQHLLNLLIFRENADFADSEVQAIMLDLFDAFVAAKLEERKQWFTITATPQDLRFQLNPREDLQADIFYAIMAAKDGEVQAYMHNNLHMRSFIYILMYTVGSKSCGFEAHNRRYWQPRTQRCTYFNMGFNFIMYALYFRLWT